MVMRYAGDLCLEFLNFPVVSKLRTSGDSRASDHSPRSRAHRQASLKRAKTRPSGDLQHETSLVKQKEVTSKVSEPVASTPNRDSVVEGTTQAMYTNDQAGDFKMVSHRADRKLRVPVVIQAIGGGDFRMTNSRAPHSDILMIAGELPSRLKLSNTGTISVDVRSDEAAVQELATNCLGGIY